MMSTVEDGIVEGFVQRSFPALSDREREVALFLVNGDSNREIAERLGLSIKTIDSHRHHILTKLGLRNNVDLARYAIRHGYVQP